jgi:hypothetical protein
MSDFKVKGLILHVGLPRTASTTLQQNVFPNMKGVRYLGKDWNNQSLNGPFNPMEIVKQSLSRYREDSSEALKSMRLMLPSLLKRWKVANQYKNDDESRHLAKMWAKCVTQFVDGLPEEDRFLYSDESLIESVIGLSSRMMHGMKVPLEQLAETGLLQDAVVSVIVRDPAGFMRASYYKNMEFEYRYKGIPISYDEYIRRQLMVYLRQPSASRIFLALHSQFIAHLRRYCPNLVVNDFESLIKAQSVLDLLMGSATREEAICMSTLPKENSTFRNEATNQFILSAKGVPEGISISEYDSGFTETLNHYGLIDLFQECKINLI